MSPAPPTPAALLELLDALETLKHLPRTGWLLRGVRDCESIADHCFRAAFTAMLLTDALRAQGVELNAERVLRMSLLHEIAECRLGDIPFAALAHLPDSAKSDAEASAATALLAPLGETGEAYKTLFEEFEARTTPESLVVRAADKLEMLVQAWEYERVGARNLDNYWENPWNVRDFDTFPFVKDFLRVLREKRDAARRTDG